MLKRFSAILLIMTLVLAGCDAFGDDDDSAEDISAEEAIDRAVERWDTTESAHFELEIEGTTYLDDDENIQLSSAEGDLVRPDSVEATAQINVGMVNLDVSLIFIGEEAFMTDFLTGSWGPAPGDFSYNPALLLSQTEGLGPVLQSLQDPQIEGTEDVDGDQAYHLTGTVTGDQIDQLTAGAITGDEIGVDIWFKTETYEVLRLDLAEPGGGEDEPTTWIIHLSDHDEPVTIERPAS